MPVGPVSSFRRSSTDGRTFPHTVRLFRGFGCGLGCRGLRWIGSFLGSRLFCHRLEICDFTLPNSESYWYHLPGQVGLGVLLNFFHLSFQLGDVRIELHSLIHKAIH